jgi:Fe-S cluster assembly protein SufD
MHKGEKKENMENTNPKDWYISSFKKFESNLNGKASSEFHKIRKNAIEVFDVLNFPTTKNEEWKYTDVAPILNYKFVVQTENNKIILDEQDFELYKINNLKAQLVVLINGFFDERYSELNELPDGVIIKSLSSAISKYPELIEEHFGKYVKFENGFIALNTALTRDGVVVYIPDNTAMEHPIHIINITGSAEGQILAQPRNLIVTGKNAEVRIIESFNSFGDDVNFNNNVTEIFAGENSHIDLYRIQNENLNSFNISRTQIEQKKDSVTTIYTVTTGGALVRNDINTVLDNENCNCNLYGLYLMDGSQHVDNHTLIDHAKPHCLSNELYKGVLNDKAHAVFNGKVFVRKDAQKTNAYQSNKNILLSKDALVDTKPQLEIYADDVKCSHGATVGQLEEEALFYLRSRGISEDNARSILIRAFANDIFDEIKIDALHDYLNEIVFEKLR